LILSLISYLYGLLYHIFKTLNGIAYSPVADAFESRAAWGGLRWRQLHT
jgi:hypothetical protein